MPDVLTRLVVQLFAWRWSRRMINALVKAQLRSPLHGMISGHVMLITLAPPNPQHQPITNNREPLTPPAW